ncbi:MAG TPA: DoxX family protein [Burkholderiaceae bacterium]
MAGPIVPPRHYDDAAKLLLRVALAVLLLLHGYAKLINGIDGIAGALAGRGWPAQAAYLVYAGELIAPLLILFGIWTRLAALVIAINMVVAIALMHMQQLATLGDTGGWALELQGFYLAAALALALQGAGRYSVAGPGGRWN